MNFLKKNIFLLVFVKILSAQILTGVIYDNNNIPLAGTNIIVDGTNLGTASNDNGEYLLKLKAGRYRIIYSYIGYTPDTIEVSINENEMVKKNIILHESGILQKSIVITGKKINTAEQIILNVIENKNDYLHQLKNYTYTAYTKTILELDRNNKTITGGVLQALSNAYYEYPDEFQECIIAKKQTKNFTEATNIITLGKIPNVLNEDIQIDEISVISPLNKNATDYYYYEMADTLVWNGQNLFVINFKPKKGNIPLFSGTLKIVDNAFTVAEVELRGGELIKTATRKGIVISEELREYQNYFRLPVKVSIDYEMDMGIPGIPGIRLRQESLISDYKLNDEDFYYNFDNNIVVLAPAAEEDEEDIWEKSQTIPLTEDEQKAVEKIDSTVSNANIIKRGILKVSDILTSAHDGIFTGFSDFYHFNKVEGNYLGVGLSSSNYLGPVKLYLRTGYGFSDEKWKLSTDLNFNFYNENKVFVSYYDNMDAVDRFSSYEPILVTFRSLIQKKDYDDYFYTRGWKAGFNFRLSNHFNSIVTVTTAEEKTAEFNSNWSLFKRNERFRENIKISEGQLSDIGFSFRYDDRKFYDYGWVRMPLESKDYTVAQIDVVSSIDKVLNSDYAYTIYHLFVSKYFAMNNYSEFNISCVGGLLTGDKVIQNHFYLNGNYGLLADPLTLRTISENYYLSDKYVSVFFEQNFRNYLFNLFNIPYLENSKYEFYIFANYAYVENDPAVFEENPFIVTGQDNIWETGFGIGNVLGFLRLDFGWALSKAKYQDAFSFQILTRLEL